MVSINEGKTLNRSSSSSYFASKQIANINKSKEKRTSINSYNKRVVELNLHQFTGIQSQSTTLLKNHLSGISSIPISACNSKQVSLDMSELVVGVKADPKQKKKETKKVNNYCAKDS